MGERALVVIPTYNEAGNLPSLVPQVLAQDPRLEILVVDDQSPDGTGQIADALAAKEPRVQVLRGDYSLIAVALPAGAKVVELTFRSKLYELGRTLSIASLAAILIALLAAVGLPRRAKHG